MFVFIKTNYITNLQIPFPIQLERYTYFDHEYQLDDWTENGISLACVCLTSPSRDHTCPLIRTTLLQDIYNFFSNRYFNNVGVKDTNIDRDLRNHTRTNDNSIQLSYSKLVDD